MVVSKMNTNASVTHNHGLSLDAAVEFLNSIELEAGQLVDHLDEPDAARSWFVEQSVIHGGKQASWTKQDLARVRTVRDALREVIDAVVVDRSPLPAAVDTVNGVLAEGIAPRLEVNGPTLRVGHQHGRSEVADALAALASPIVAELASGRPDRFRTCANDTCRWSFYDASPTGRRRWCDMKTCGNRAKAARHRERARGIEIIEIIDPAS